MRSMSSVARTSPSRFAWPRTINWSRALRRRRTTRPGRRRPGGRRCRRAPGAPRAAQLRFPPSPPTSVRPRTRALRKLLASTSAEAGMPGRRRDHAVLDRAVLGDQDRQRLGRLQAHEFDMLEPRVDLARQHHARAAREFGQEARRFGERALESAALRRRPHLAVDARALLAPQIAELEQRVDEQPQALLGRQAPGARVRGVDETELLEVLHHVAHRGRRQRHRQHARQVPGADGLAGGEIGVDDVAEDLARAGVERRQCARFGGTFCGCRHGAQEWLELALRARRRRFGSGD